VEPALQAQAQGGFGISLEMSFIFSLLAYQLIVFIDKDFVSWKLDWI
jgi:hypothetical protein